MPYNNTLARCIYDSLKQSFTGKKVFCAHDVFAFIKKTEYYVEEVRYDSKGSFLRKLRPCLHRMKDAGILSCVARPRGAMTYKRTAYYVFNEKVPYSQYTNFNRHRRHKTVLAEIGAEIDEKGPSTQSVVNKALDGALARSLALNDVESDLAVNLKLKAVERWGSEVEMAVNDLMKADGSMDEWVNKAIESQMGVIYWIASLKRRIMTLEEQEVNQYLKGDLVAEKQEEIGQWEAVAEIYQKERDQLRKEIEVFKENRKEVTELIDENKELNQKLVEASIVNQNHQKAHKELLLKFTRLAQVLQKTEEAMEDVRDKTMQLKKFINKGHKGKYSLGAFKAIREKYLNELSFEERQVRDEALKTGNDN